MNQKEKKGMSKVTELSAVPNRTLRYATMEEIVALSKAEAGPNKRIIICMKQPNIPQSTNTNKIVSIKSADDPLRINLNQDQNAPDFEDDPLLLQIKSIKQDHAYSSNSFFECDLCQANLENWEALVTHFITDHSSSPKKFVCLKCGRTFVSSTLLKKHMNLHKSEVEDPIYCDICEDRFKTEDLLFIHLDKHQVIFDAMVKYKSRGSFKCLFCSYISKHLKSFSHLSKHEYSKHNAELNHACKAKDCKQKFTHEYLLKAHEVCHQPEIIDLEGVQHSKYPCLVCKFEFDSLKALKYHLLIHLDYLERSEKYNLNHNRIANSKYNSELCSCTNCGSTFLHKKDLDLHTQYCSNILKICEKCPEFHFLTVTDLITHIIERHESKEDAKQYKCCNIKCIKSFSTIFMLKRHLRNHEDFMCSLCQAKIPNSKHIDWKEVLKVHLEVHRESFQKEKYFNCSKCSKCFTSLEFITTHYLTHPLTEENTNEEPSKLSCHCSSTFNSPDELAEHLSLHTGDDLFLCEPCKTNNLKSPSLFRSKDSLEAHISKMHSYDDLSLPTLDFNALINENSNFEPNEATQNIMTANLEDIDKNSKSTDHKTIKPSQKKKKKVKCNVCDKILGSKSAFINHQFTHPELFVFKCLQPNCESKFISELQLLTHSQIHNDLLDEPLFCYCCGTKKPFSNSEELKRHLKIHTKNKSATCPDCGITVGNSTTLKNHTIAFHKPDPQNSFNCDMCDAKYALICNLKSHKQRAHSTSEHVCDECGRVYNSYVGLYGHKRDQHCKEMEQCEHCGEVVPKVKFKAHLLKMHKIDTIIRRQKPAWTRQLSNNNNQSIVTKMNIPVTCYFCLGTFPNIYSLNNHFQIHTMEHPFTCFHCPKRFQNPQLLAYHKKKYHFGMDTNESDSKIICDICQKVFKLRHTYNTHMNFHRGIKPYKCPICLKGFPNSLSRAGHMFSHRSLDPKEINKSSATLAYSKRWKAYKCNICPDKSYKVKAQFNYHMNAHKGLFPYKCHICGQRSAHSGWFRGHKKTHVMLGDYEKRPSHLKGQAPYSDNDDEEMEETAQTSEIPLQPTIPINVPNQDDFMFSINSPSYSLQLI